MTTQRYRLNRVVTVSGASAETEERPIEWRMDFQDGVGISGTASTQLPSLGRYAFNRGSYSGSWHYDAGPRYSRLASNRHSHA